MDAGLPTPTDKQPRGNDLAALAVALCSILLQGHKFGTGNQEIFLPTMRRILDPGHLSRDWILDTAVGHPLTTYPLAYLCALVGEANAMLLAQVGTRWLLMAGVWRLARALSPGMGPVGLTLAMVFVALEPRLWIGGHFLQGPVWEAAHLGMAAAVWMFAEAIRWSAAPSRQAAVRFGAAAGLGILAHLFIGLPLAIFLMLGFRIFRAERLQLAIAAAVAAVVGAASVLPAAMQFLEPTTTVLTTKNVIQLLQWRHPHHHAPWSWPSAHWFEAFLLLGGVLLLLRRFPIRGRVAHVFLGCYAANCALFAICARLQIFETVAFFQAFRHWGLVVALAAVGVAEALELAALRREIPARLLPLLPVLFKLFPGTVALPAALLAPGRSEPAAPGADIPRRLTMPMCLAGAGMLVLLQFVAPIRELSNRLRKDHWRVSAESSDPDRAALDRFFREQTPEDALVVIPPDLPAFRVAARRAVYVDVKHFPFRNADLAEWQERYTSVMGPDFLSPDPRGHSRGYWQPAQFSIPATPWTKVDCDFVVHRYDPQNHQAKPTAESHPRWRVVYRNDTYLVLAPLR